MSITRDARLKSFSSSTIRQIWRTHKNSKVLNKTVQVSKDVFFFRPPSGIVTMSKDKKVFLIYCVVNASQKDALHPTFRTKVFSFVSVFVEFNPHNHHSEGNRFYNDKITGNATMAVYCLTVTSKALVRPQAISCRKFFGQNSTKACFFLCQDHSKNSPYPLAHVSPTIFNLSNWQYR